MQLIDAHQHLVGPSFTPESLAAPVQVDAHALLSILNEHAVERTVGVQATPSPEATQRALSTAQETAHVGGAVVWVDLEAGDAPDVMDRLRSFTKLRGLCLPVWRESDNHWLLREDVLRGMQAAADRHLSVDLWVAPRQIPSVTRLAEMVPHLRIVLDHMGSPFIGRCEREPWGVHMLNLAAQRNVMVKLSGLVTLDAPRWHVAHLRLFVESVVRLFGYERMMFGSDWPAHETVATYGQVMEAALASAGPLTDRQRERLMRGTAEEFYRPN